MADSGGKAIYVHRASLWGGLGLIFAQIPIYLSRLFDEPWETMLIVLGGAGLLSSVAAVMYGNQTTKRLNQRSKQGLCLECGYDLRTKPAKCPECGTANPYLLEEQPTHEIHSPAPVVIDPLFSRFMRALIFPLLLLPPLATMGLVGTWWMRQPGLIPTSAIWWAAGIILVVMIPFVSLAVFLNRRFAPRTVANR